MSKLARCPLCGEVPDTQSDLAVCPLGECPMSESWLSATTWNLLARLVRKGRMWEWAERADRANGWHWPEVKTIARDWWRDRRAR